MQAQREYCRYKGMELVNFAHWEVKRDDPILVKIVEKMGVKAGGAHTSLKVVEIPDGVDWEIDEYDGLEWVAEKHRTWS